MCAASADPIATAAARRRDGRRWPWALAVVALLAVALALRLWGIRTGLPYVYNVDENATSCRGRSGCSGTRLNPHYFVNPPAFTYLLHARLRAAATAGAAASSHAFAADPAQRLRRSRASPRRSLGDARRLAAATSPARGCSTAASGCSPAALLAVAFLPVFYAHLALNDAPTLVGVCLSLWGAAGIARRRAAARLRARRARARARRGDEVHRRDRRCCRSSRRGRASGPSTAGARVWALRAARRSPASWRSPRSSSPTRTRSTSGTRSPTALAHQSSRAADDAPASSA